MTCTRYCCVTSSTSSAPIENWSIIALAISYCVIMCTIDSFVLPEAKTTSGYTQSGECSTPLACSAVRWQHLSNSNPPLGIHSVGRWHFKQAGSSGVTMRFGQLSVCLTRSEATLGVFSKYSTRRLRSVRYDHQPSAYICTLR